jgi:hypothetical protein
MVNEKLGIVASAGWVLPVIAFLGVASANAQEVTWLRNLEVNQPVPDLGQSVSLLDMANSGMASISDLKVDLSLSSSAENNLMWLGQVYVSLTYGVASEEERTAVLLNRPGVSSSNLLGSSLSSLNVTLDDSAMTNIFNVASGTGTYQADGRLSVNPYGNLVAYSPSDINAGLSALNGGLLQSQKLILLVADTQQGASAKLDRWGVKIKGMAANSGTIDTGAGGSVASTGTGVQSVGATVHSASTGAGAVGLLASANQTLNLNGGVSGSGDFNKTGSGTVKVGDSAGFTGKLNVNEGKVLVAGTLGTTSTTTVRSGGLLGGSGTLGSVVWDAGATYEWGLRNVTGVAGTDWDLIRVAGAMDLSLLNSGGKFNLNLLSDGSFDLGGGYEWTFLQAASFSGLGGLNLTQYQDITSLFNITASGFNGGTDAPGIKVLVGSTNGGFTSLNIQASSVPEPATGSLMMFGLGGLVLTRLLRRKQS